MAKRPTMHKQETIMFVLMGLILLGLIVAGYILFVDKILPGFTARESSFGEPTRKIGASSQEDSDSFEMFGPGEGQVVTLYFGERGKDNLVRELRKIAEDKVVISKARKLLLELIKGPLQQRSRPVLPPGTTLRSLFYHQGVFIVDFSAEIIDNHPAGASEEILTVYSVVNTLTELDKKSRVKILVNGQEVPTLRGHSTLSGTLSRYEKIIRN